MGIPQNLVPEGIYVRCGIFILQSDTELNGKLAIVFLYSDMLIIGVIESSRTDREVSGTGDLGKKDWSAKYLNSFFLNEVGVSPKGKEHIIHILERI